MSNEVTSERIIRFCTKVLEHDPSYLRLETKEGWVSIKKLLEGFERKGLVCTKKDLLDAIKKYPERKIAVSGDKNRVRYDAKIKVEKKE